MAYLIVFLGLTGMFACGFMWGSCYEASLHRDITNHDDKYHDKRSDWETGMGQDTHNDSD